PRTDLDRNRMPRYLSGGLDHLKNALALSGSDVEGLGFPRGNRLNCEQMRVRQILNVDVITNARPIRSWIVCPEYGNVLALAKGDLKYQRNQVDFGFVILANRPVRRRAAGIEIAKRN